MWFYQVLVGTKSLLGEGWDAPCVNSHPWKFCWLYACPSDAGPCHPYLIGHPDKTSNIWHLVAIKPYKNPVFSKEDQEELDLNPYQDLQTLARRMDHFLGLSYKVPLKQVWIAWTFLSSHLRKRLEDYNEKIMELSKDRASLRKKWQESHCCWQD